MHNKARVCMQAQALHMYARPSPESGILNLNQIAWNSHLSDFKLRISPWVLKNSLFCYSRPPELSSLQKSPLKTAIKPKGHWNISLPSISPNKKDPEILIFYCREATLRKHLERAPHFWLDDSRRNRWKEWMAACSVMLRWLWYNMQSWEYSGRDLSSAW